MQWWSAESFRVKHFATFRIFVADLMICYYKTKPHPFNSQLPKD